MKIGATEKLKFKKLMAALDISKPHAAGILEMLWHTTIHNAPAGDIGKLDDTDIALLIGWDGEPEKLINALLDTGWIDEDAQFRLIIHDWHEHAPAFLRGSFAARGLLFAKGGSKTPAKGGATYHTTPHHTNSYQGGNAKSEEVGSGGGNGQVDGRLRDVQRKQEVTTALSEVGIDNAETRRRIADREGMTAEIVRTVAAEVRQDGRVKNPGGVIRYRLMEGVPDSNGDWRVPRKRGRR